MDTTTRYTEPAPHKYTGDCAPVPEFRRNQFVYGQLMGAADFRAEQSYFREKQRLHNRCLHGYGVVCGLLVHPADDPRDCAPNDTKEEEDLKRQLAELEQKRKENDKAPSDIKVTLDTQIERLRARLKESYEKRCAAAPPTRVVIDCGIALDCEGNELVVRRPLVIDLWRELSAEDRKRAGDGDHPIYLSLCYCEQPIDPIRPVLADQCGVTPDCAYGKLRESVRVTVGLAPPEEDKRCETCCSACGECCLLLARVDGFRRGDPVGADAIHNEVRRRLSKYQPTVITGINWVHGGAYNREVANDAFGFTHDAGGFEIHFSRPVRASTIKQGVVELWLIEGGGGQAGDISEIPGRYLDLPKSGMVTKVRYRPGDEDPENDENRDRLDFLDRVLITVRCAFILDECCQPVDGANIGGRVPALPSSKIPDDYVAQTECAIPPWGYGPWTSGNGTPGSTFESWVGIVSKSDRDKKNKLPLEGDKIGEVR